MKHIHHLTEQGNAGEERDRLASQLQGPTFAIPVFIKGEDAIGHLVTETELASDVRPR